MKSSSSKSDTVESTVYSDDPEIDAAFKKYYSNGKRNIIDLQFRNQLPSSHSFKILTTSRSLKGNMKSPSDTLFRTHTYEFRFLVPKDDMGAKVNIAAVHVKFLHKAKPAVAKQTKQEYEEALSTSSPLITYTQINNPADDYLVTMTWVDGLKMSFRGVFKIALYIYGFSKRDCSQMDLIAYYLSETFTVVSKPGVWINNQKKLADTGAADDDGSGDDETSKKSKSKKRSTAKATPKSASKIVKKEATVPANSVIPQVNLYPATPIISNQINTALLHSSDFTENNIPISNTSAADIAQLQNQFFDDQMEDEGLISENLELTSQEQVLLNNESQTDVFAPFLSLHSQLLFPDPNTPMKMLSPNGAIMMNESLGEITGNSKFLTLSFGDLEGVRGRQMSSQEWDQLLNEDPNTNGDKFFEKNLFQDK